MSMNRHRIALMLVVAIGLALPATPQTAQTPNSSAQPAQPGPANKGVIQARTQAEYEAYQAIKNKPQTPEEFEKAAGDFAAKFPDSNLRVVLYRGVMQSYQQADNSDKMLTAGLKVLSLDKDDPEALIVVGEIQEEHTSPMDLDREQRMDQSLANAQHALQTIDTDLAVPAGAQPEKVDAYKNYLRSTALAIVGKIQYKRQQYAEAEATLRKALDADSAHPDPVVLLSLSLSLDMQKKYQDALQEANRAVDLTKEDTEVGKSARGERDRLIEQTGGNTASPPTAPDSTAEPSSAPQSN